MLAASEVRPSGAPIVELRPAPPPVRIDVYDGPLDLLLFLVRREGVDLRRIPCARICDAYLAFLDQADDIDVDVAGDYLLMAATLCQLKARELLPRAPDPRPDDAEEEDPRDALARRLLDYERFRAAAEALGARTRLDRDVFARPATPVRAEEAPVEAGLDGFGLARLFYVLLQARAAPEPVHHVVREAHTFAERVRWVLERLDDGAEHTLSELFVEVATRPQRVLTFLAVLEMAKLRMLDVWQRVHLGAVSLVGRVTADAADLTTLPEDA